MRVFFGWHSSWKLYSGVPQGAHLNNEGVADHLHHHDVVVGLCQAHPGAHAHSLVQQGVACTADARMEAKPQNSESYISWSLAPDMQPPQRHT